MKIPSKPSVYSAYFLFQRVHAPFFLAFLELKSNKNNNENNKAYYRCNRLNFFAFFLAHRDVCFKPAGWTNTLLHQRLATAAMHLLRLNIAVTGFGLFGRFRLGGFPLFGLYQEHSARR